MFGLQTADESLSTWQSIVKSWHAFETSAGAWMFFGIGAFSTLIGLYLCYRMYQRLSEKNGFFNDLPRLISHVPHSTITAKNHIWAGVFLFSGVSMMAGMACAKIFSADMNLQGYMATSAGLGLGILTLALSFWTLYQTKKLERLQGENINRFDELIASITDRIKTLIDKYDENRDKSSSLFRVYLVTNNPYFGVNSYRGKRVTLDYKNAFDRLADRIKAFRQSTSSTVPGQGFKLKVICADCENVAQFNSHYYTTEKQAEHTLANCLTEEFITELKEAAGDNCFIRIPMPIAEVQFAVIADTVYEFILTAPNDHQSKARGSDIKYTTRIEDRVVADRFERYMVFLENLIQHSPNARLGGSNGKDEAMNSHVAEIEERNEITK